MEYALIEHGSDAYKQSLSLRHEILRVPLGMDLYDGSYEARNTGSIILVHLMIMTWLPVSWASPHPLRK